MFTVTDQYLFTRPVKVQVPTKTGTEQQEFKATFRMMPAEDFDSYDLSTTEGSTRFLEAIVVELHDLVDDANKALAYSDTLRDKLLAFQFVRLALTAAYIPAHNGAPAGN